MAGDDLRSLGFRTRRFALGGREHGGFRAGDLLPVRSVSAGFGWASTASRTPACSIWTLRECDGSWGSGSPGTDDSSPLAGRTGCAAFRSGDLATSEESHRSTWGRGWRGFLVRHARFNEAVTTTDRSSQSDTGTRSSRSHDHGASRRPRMVGASAISTSMCVPFLRDIRAGKRMEEPGWQAHGRAHIRHRW